jgi:hypothetical protein
MVNQHEGDADQWVGERIDTEPAVGRWQLDRNPHTVAARHGSSHNGRWRVACGQNHTTDGTRSIADD